METGEKKFINGYISREIMKIVLKLVVTIGLTFLALKYNFFVRGTDKVEYMMELLLTFCILYFLCSVMQFSFQTCHFVVTALVTGVIAIIVLLILLSLLPEVAQGYVFIGAMVLAVLCDLIRLVGHAKSYVREMKLNEQLIHNWKWF